MKDFKNKRKRLKKMEPLPVKGENKVSGSIVITPAKSLLVTKKAPINLYSYGGAKEGVGGESQVSRS